MRGFAAATAKSAIADCQLVGLALQPRGDVLHEQLAHLGTGETQRSAAHRDRVAAGGEALRRALACVAGDDAHALRRDVELLGGDLRQRREDTLADLHLAGGDADTPAGLEADPAIEARIVGEALRQSVVAHGFAPAIIRPARCTARMMRLCTPQRQR